MKASYHVIAWTFPESIMASREVSLVKVGGTSCIGAFRLKTNPTSSAE